MSNFSSRYSGIFVSVNYLSLRADLMSNHTVRTSDHLPKAVTYPIRTVRFIVFFFLITPTCTVKYAKMYVCQSNNVCIDCAHGLGHCAFRRRFLRRFIVQTISHTYDCTARARTIYLHKYTYIRVCVYINTQRAQVGSSEFTGERNDLFHFAVLLLIFSPTVEKKNANLIPIS